MAATEALEGRIVSAPVTDDQITGAYAEAAATAMERGKLVLRAMFERKCALKAVIEIVPQSERTVRSDIRPILFGLDTTSPKVKNGNDCRFLEHLDAVTVEQYSEAAKPKPRTPPETPGTESPKDEVAIPGESGTATIKPEPRVGEAVDMLKALASCSERQIKAGMIAAYGDDREALQKLARAAIQAYQSLGGR